jgi:UDP-N-acetylmuramate--alanine ligase
MQLNDFSHIYFLGIGGIGMSALARWFNSNGYKVSGYDKTPTILTGELQNEGMEIHFYDAIEHIPQYIIENKDKTLVVVTPAIPAEHAELNYLRSAGFKIMKRSEVLGMLTAEHMTIAVAGTHGKTTTSAMIGYLLKESGMNCTAFLGGILQNYNNNFLTGRGDGHTHWVVVEADEFDRSFHTLNPTIAVLTSADPDHLDIYKSQGAVEKAYAEFLGKIKSNGQLFINHTIDIPYHTRSGVGIKTYGLSGGDHYAANIKNQQLGYTFDLMSGSKSLGSFQLNMPGLHNVENAVAAISAVAKAGVPYARIQELLPGFKGVKRRFSVLLHTPQITFIDDYAHHPTEIEALLDSLRQMFPEKKLAVIFQPHLFTRTRDFASGFAQALSMADVLYMLDIYPARELPLPGVTSDTIFSRVDLMHKKRVTKESLLKCMEEDELEVVVTVGAGDIDTLVAPIYSILNRRALAK